MEPSWVSGSVGGGVLHESEDWLAGLAEISCDDPAAGSSVSTGWD